MAEKVYPNVLIVTDDSPTARAALELLARRDVRGKVVRSLPDARSAVDDAGWAMVVIDMQAPGGDPLSLLRAVRAEHPELPVVMIGPDNAVQPALQATRHGCTEWLISPLAEADFAELLDRLLPAHQVSLAASAQADSHCLYQLAGKSKAFLHTIDQARRVAPTSVPLLISGESGTGKELISYLVHHQSSRSRGPYIRVNCAALSESLLESELFGHERGAFTGAVAQHKGRFEQAHGGTLLLDEISETGPRLQAELLRVLETQDFERVGGSEPIRVNVRIISTTNRDLAREVEEGNFRRDLYYRLSGVHLTVPALRDRTSDVPELVWHFVNQYTHEVRRKITKLDSEMVELFRQCRWPGNVRQLRNVVRAALIFGEGPVLNLDGVPHLADELRRQSLSVPAELAGKGTSRTSVCLQDVEREAIFEALRRTQRNQTKAAELLGITDRTLRDKLRKYKEQGQFQAAGDSRW